MKIKKLSLENYGIFDGVHIIDLDVKQKDKPVILFGGMNGSGKTTLLNSIKLCLYGKEFFGNISKSKYHEFLKNKIYYSDELLLPPNKSSVEIIFEYSKFGDVSEYCVKRYWENNNSKISEYLIVTKNGKELDEVEKNYWNSFIKEILPLGISQLFFFDGEKIQEMTAGDNYKGFEDSLKLLVGIESIEQLERDLKNYRRKFLKKDQNKKTKEILNQEEKRKEEIEKEISLVKENQAEIKDKILSLKNELEKRENKLKSNGFEFYQNRENLKVELSKTINKTDILENEIKDKIGKLFPLGLCSNLAERLIKQLENELEHKEISYTRNFLNKKSKELVKNSDILEDKTINELINKLTEMKSENIQEIFGYSEHKAINIIENLKKSKRKSKKILKTLIDELEKNNFKISENQKKLDNIPDEITIKPLLEKINSLNYELGENQKQFELFQIDIENLLKGKTEIERNMEKIQNKLSEKKKNDIKYNLLVKTQNVLKKYKKKLNSSKLDSIQNEFKKIFNLLHRKEDLVHDIKIDEENMDVYLLDNNGSKIDKSKLSSGELTIYSMAMLWALAKTTKQKLPFIIDTPMGRLDSKHRDNLIKMYFPQASHQVIIFSTNTEIDPKYFNVLKPNISKCYNLEYDQLKKKTKIKEGYFWE